MHNARGKLGEKLTKPKYGNFKKKKKIELTGSKLRVLSTGKYHNELKPIKVRNSVHYSREKSCQT